MRDDHTPWFFVAIYECDRAYGGAEEGGWYYDTGTLYPEVMPIVCQEHEVKGNLAMLEERIKELDLNAGRYEPNSVLCNGYYMAQSFEGECPEHFPKERPYYE